MKKLLLIMILAAGFAASNAQDWIVKVSRPETYSLTAGDTMNIYKSDKIVGIGINVPSGATDTVWVKGAVGTIDGFTSGYIPFAPGTSFDFGYDDMVRIDSIEIVVKDEAGVILIPTKK